MSSLLTTLFSYNAWANADLCDKMKSVDSNAHSSEFATALGLICHYNVVAKIFSGHLQGLAHGFTSDTLEVTAPLDELRSQVLSVDQWYIEYIKTISDESLAETVSFSFTDGDKGLMSREEMLLHVALHATVHRGEVARLLWQLSLTPPWETLAVFVHQCVPQRRLQGLRPTQDTQATPRL